MAKTPRTYLVNPGDAGVVYDEAGHSLGGGERIEVPELDAVGRAAVDAQRLRVHTEPDTQTAEPPPEQEHTTRQRNRRARETGAAEPQAQDSGASEPS